MKSVLGSIAAGAFALTAFSADAAPIDITDFGYDTRTVELTDIDVSVDAFLNLDSTALDIFALNADGSFSLDFFLDGFLSPELNFAGHTSIIVGAVAEDITADTAEFLFEDMDAAFVVTLLATGADFLGVDEFNETDATVTVERLSATVIPLPATVWLMIAGLGGMVAAGWRKASRS